ncbi:MAG: hypothetical protein KAH54_03190 [Candidatus Sabulitectum sp.]|nr:hypothetical protein [Candidatus Sabulitectum sp.]
MISIPLLMWSLILLTPVSGVVSGGRSISCGMEGGLIHVSEWMHVPGLPVEKRGSFSEITFQGGVQRVFRVISSGETAGFNPLIASRVTTDGFAAQMAVGVFSMLCLKTEERENYSVSYDNATIDFRGSSFSDLRPGGEYHDKYLLIAATENTSALGFSIPFCETLAIGPAYTTDRSGADIWLLGEAALGPAKIVFAPAIDEESSYQRVYGLAEYDAIRFIYGWNGLEQFGELSLCGEGFITAVSLPYPGVMVGYQPSDNILLMVSHSEGGFFQGEIQGEYLGITTGLELLRSSRNVVQWGFSVGIDIGRSDMGVFSTSDSTWFSRIAVTPLQE